MNSKRVECYQLLESLLKAIINEWGIGKVRECLLDLETRGETANILDKTAGKSRVPRKYSRPSAVSLATKAELPSNKKQLILKLAEKFDRKEFLPTAGHIRYFCDMNNAPIGAVKQRPDAFRKVLKLLANMPEESLQLLLDHGQHTGPSALGPLSQAMRSIGEQRTQRVRDVNPPATEEHVNESEAGGDDDGPRQPSFEDKINTE